MGLSAWPQYEGHQTLLDNGKVYLDYEKAVGAPANWRYGYLMCGCRHDGNFDHWRG